MKVLFTGMASSHGVPTSNVTFFGLLAKSVDELATVEWHVPSVTWTKEFLDSYDAVFVGLVPPTSPSANKVYGAMHVINLMYESPKLHLVIDHPQLWQFKSSIASIARSVDSIFTPFYSSRREFKIAKDFTYASSVLNAARKLIEEPWPKTIYPDLPWKELETFSKFLGPAESEHYIGVNLDYRLFTEPKLVVEKNHFWSVDNPNTSWSRKISKLLSMPLEPMKNKPRDTDAQVLEKISSGVGVIIAPQDRGVGTWWSYRHIQAMNTFTPIVSDWRETGALSADWDILASTVEEMNAVERLEMASAQRRAYIASVPSEDYAIDSLQTILFNSKEGSYANAGS